MEVVEPVGDIDLASENDHSDNQNMASVYKKILYPIGFNYPADLRKNEKVFR